MKKVSATGMSLASEKKFFSFNIVSSLLSLVEPLARIYSDILEKPVSPRQTLHLLHVQIAALMLLLPVSAPLAYYALATVWCGLALRGCAESFRHPKP